jgi:hypothetical protein
VLSYTYSFFDLITYLSVSRFVAVVTNTVNTIMLPCNPINQTVAFSNIHPFAITRDPEVQELLLELPRPFPGDMTELHS